MSHLDDWAQHLSIWCWRNAYVTPQCWRWKRLLALVLVSNAHGSHRASVSSLSRNANYQISGFYEGKLRSYVECLRIPLPFWKLKVKFTNWYDRWSVDNNADRFSKKRRFIQSQDFGKWVRGLESLFFEMYLGTNNLSSQALFPFHNEYEYLKSKNSCCEWENLNEKVCWTKGLGLLIQFKG